MPLGGCDICSGSLRFPLLRSESAGWRSHTILPLPHRRKVEGIATDKETQGPLESATSISRRRFLKGSALASAVVAIPYLADKSVAFGKESPTSPTKAAEVADVDTGRRIRVEDRMRIASAAKAFSGAVALSLVSQGKLSLEDTIGKRLPELSEAWHETWQEVTLRQLLNHTSGIPDFSLDPAFRDAVLASLNQAPPPEELLSFVEDEPLSFEPGSEYRYSNSDNIVVALMVEEATGKTMAAELLAGEIGRASCRERV